MNNQAESNQKENQLIEPQAEAFTDLLLRAEPAGGATGSFANHNEATLGDEDDEDPALLNDLPVAQSELDMVKGGAADPLPVLLVISDQRDFYYR